MINEGHMIMDKNLRRFYNNELKMNFINDKLAKSTSYINAYYSLFDMSNEIETFYNKDLYEFTTSDIEMFLKSIAPNIKYMSALLYNDLIRDYKRWVDTNTHLDVISLEGCPIGVLKDITTFKAYTILNDDDINEITKESVIDGGDYIPVIFIRLLWELDAQVDISDIIKIKVTDLVKQNNTIIIGGTPYSISPNLLSFIYNFAKLDYIDYRYKGRYKIPTSEKNGGYIFRTRATHKTVLGKPMTRERFSDIFHDYVERNYNDAFAINDIVMSLALKHMLKYKKTHTIMQTEKRYFSKVTSHVYGDVLVNYGKEKFPNEYNDYLQYFNSLRVNC
jgi:hypothetical protein